MKQKFHLLFVKIKVSSAKSYFSYLMAESFSVVLIAKAVYPEVSTLVIPM